MAQVQPVRRAGRLHAQAAGLNAAARVRELIAELFNDRGVDLLKLFSRNGSLISWRIGVWSIRRASAVSRDEEEQRRYLGNLCQALQIRYERDDDPAHLDGAIEFGRRAVAGLTEAGIEEAQRMAGLGVALRLRFEHTSQDAVDPVGEDGETDLSGVDFGDLDEAEQWCRLAVDCTPEDEPFRSEAERALADVILSRYERSLEVELLDEAISAYRTAARPHGAGCDEAGANAGSAAHAAAVAEALSSLSVALRMRYSRFGGEGVLAEAILCAEQAIEAADDPGELGLRLSELALALDVRYESTREPADGAEAVRVHRVAVAALPVRHPERFAAESNLGRSLRAYGQHKGGLGYVVEAVALRRGALAVAVAHGRNRAVIESELGRDLNVYFEMTGDESALMEALDHARRAEVAARGTPNEPEASSNLGHILRTVYDRRSGEQYFEEALRVCRRAVEITPDDDESRPEYLSNLSNVLLSGFETTGDRARLAEAITLAKAAAYDDRPGRVPDPDLSSNLSNLLALQFENTGDLDTLREAVAASRQSLDLVSGRPSSRPGKLSNLSRALLVLYERTSDMSALEESVDLSRESVATCPADDPDLPIFLHGFGNALFTRFEEVQADGDVHEAVSVYRRAVDLCPDEHRDRPMHVGSLGMGLLGLGEHFGDPAALDESITTLRSSVDSVDGSDPELAKRLNNLGLAYQTRGGEGDLAAATQSFRQAAQSTVAPTSVRLHAGEEWGLAAGAAGDWRQATEAFELCVELLPRIAAPSLNRLDQEHHLTLFPDLSTEAAVSALEAGLPERALMMVEQARGVLLAQALRMRPDIAALEVAAPDLARRLEELRAALDSAPEVSARPDSRRYDARAAMEAELGEIAAEIRGLPGLADFLKPPTLDGLLDQARSGPVVFLTTHERRSDALIVDARGLQGLRVTPLPLLTPDSAAGMQARFAAALLVIEGDASSGEEQEAAEGVLREVLGELWDAVAEPVLRELGFVASADSVAAAASASSATMTSTSVPDMAPQDELPRLWWVSTGPFAALPLHAAGHHDAEGSGGRSVLDCVVSSYTPTIDALRHARERTGPVRPPRILAVGMTKTPDRSGLPGAALEIANVQSHFLGASTALLDGEATWQRVHDLLPAYTWAHFACHGLGDMAEPSASRLLLSDHLDRPLTVLDVSRLRLEHAELAVLSACETTRPAERLPGEAVHVATAFQLAGFRQVIGTLWPVGDRVARRFVDEVYGHLAADGGDVPAGAQAVHAATLALRDRHRDHPSFWSPFVHAGR